MSNISFRALMLAVWPTSYA